MRAGAVVLSSLPIINLATAAALCGSSRGGVHRPRTCDAAGSIRAAHDPAERRPASASSPASSARSSASGASPIDLICDGAAAARASLDDVCAQTPRDMPPEVRNVLEIVDSAMMAGAWSSAVAVLRAAVRRRDLRRRSAAARRAHSSATTRRPRSADRASSHSATDPYPSPWQTESPR